MIMPTQVVAYAIPMVLPVVLGLALLWLCRRMPALGSHPARTAFALFVLLSVANAIVTPAGDLISPAVGGIVSVVVCVVVYIAMQRRLEPR